MSNEWQPIETAPKDGERVVLLWGEGLRGYPYLGSWQDFLDLWDTDAGFVDADAVTHWMTLPNPPKQEA